jgi:hypothetical protein
MRLGLALSIAVLLAALPEAASAQSYRDRDASLRSSPRARRTVRPPTRIEVRPLYYPPGKLQRDCVPVFEERLIPQWGGSVLYASQRCWWTRG